MVCSPKRVRRGVDKRAGELPALQTGAKLQPWDWLWVEFAPVSKNRVCQATVPKQLQSSSHSSSSGHYTTVCRQPDTGILAGQLLFSCSSPVLTSLRVMPQMPRPESTQSHYHCGMQTPF